MAVDDERDLDEAGAQSLGETGGPEGLHEDLPPVQPPSAGFIVQLFVVPGLIVLVVVGLLGLFNKLASEEQDWRSLVGEINSPNQHVRDRAMFSLAQLLDADQGLGEEGQQLSRNPQVVSPLTAQLQETLDDPASSAEAITHRVFLTRTLGMMDLPDVVFPVLGEAMSDQQDVEVRKSAVASVALIAGRAQERGTALDTPESKQVVDDLAALSADSDPVLRQASAFTLGLFPGDASGDRLVVLLEDRDEKTRVNAAIGLARRQSPAGFPVFREVLRQAGDRKRMEQVSADQLLERQLVLSNSLKAIERLAADFGTEERQELERLLGPVADDDPDARIRVEAAQARTALESAG